MKTVLFQGVCTALVTPFDQHGHIHMPMLHRLLARQIDAGIPAVVISGTTGESPVLTDSEKIALFREAKKVAEGRTLIIAGTGSNNTAHAADLSRAAQEAGADALLVVTPYYNKATPQGLLKHFRTVADSVSIPILLYNVPSRTGVDLPVSVCRELAQVSNIVGIKEASPDLRKAAHLRAALPADFAVWSGNDDLTLPMIAMGASGVISVTANLFPARMKVMTDAALQGRLTEARADFMTMLELMDQLFQEVNPIPVKAAMKHLGLDCGSCRLPLTDLTGEHEKQLASAIRRLSGPETENS